MGQDRAFELSLIGRLDLRDAGGSEVRRLLARPKLLALLAYLVAARPHGFQRRDRLVAVFWPELDQARARNALRQAVHHLRGALGPDVLRTRGDEDLGVDPALLTCDVVTFTELLDAGRNADALELARGELLPGFHLQDAPDFERWLDEEREHLRRRVAAAAAVLAREAEAEGSLVGAAHWARRAAEVVPYDEEALRRLLALLDRAGDRAGAVQAYETFARRLGADLELEPAPETQALITGIRARIEEHERGEEARATPGPVSEEPRAAPGPGGTAVPPTVQQEPTEWKRVTVHAVGTVVLVAVAILALAFPDTRTMIAGRLGTRGAALAGVGLLLVALAQQAGALAARATARERTRLLTHLATSSAGYALLAAGLVLGQFYASAALVVVLALGLTLARTRVRRAAGVQVALLGPPGVMLQVGALAAAFIVEGHLTAQPVNARDDAINVFVVLSFEPSTTLSPALAMRLWQTYVRTFANIFSTPTFHVHPQQFTAETFGQFTLQETPEEEIVSRLRRLRPPPDLVVTSAVRFDEGPDFVRIGSFVRRVEGARLSAPLTRAIVQEGHVDDVWHHALMAATTFLEAIDRDVGVELADSAEQRALRHALALFADGIVTRTSAADDQPGLDSLLALSDAGVAITPFDVARVMSQFSHDFDTPDDAARRRSALSKAFGR